MRYIENPPNPWLTHTVEWIGEPPEARVEVFEETETRSIITHNNSPDVGFDYSVNCYRGCAHACTYCFSRPTHEYLGYGAGTDFERKIVAKVRAPELLRAEFMRRSWQGSPLVFSFTSDPYVPLEAHYKLTRRCLEVCLEFRNPVSIVIKACRAPHSRARFKSSGMSSLKPGMTGAIPSPTSIPAAANSFIARNRASGEGAKGSTARAVS